MRILRPSDKGYAKQITSLNRRFLSDPAVCASVTEILAGVRADGDKALVHYVKKFGGPDLEPRQVPVTPSEVAQAIAALPAHVKKALDASRANVKAFAKKSLRKSWFTKKPPRGRCRRAI